MTGDAEMTMRAETTDDIEEIARVVEAAFGSPREARLVAAIRASEGFVRELSLVAVVDRRVVGHVMVSEATLIENATVHTVANLSPLAVEPGYQGRGIGSSLVREVARRADVRGEPVVVLEGSPAFYGRLGFESSTRFGIHITLPAWAPPEAAQVLRLSAYDPVIRGTVVYPSAFDEVTHA